MRNIRRRARKGQQNIDGKSLSAPTGGWDAVSPIANMPTDRAIVLDNWFPTPSDVRVRRGFQTFCSGMGSGVVETLMAYNARSTVNSKLFAVTGKKIFDVGSGTAISNVTGLGSNRWQYVNFSTPGGHFLWACNGIDVPRTYNETAGWATPSLTLTTFTANDIVNVNAHKERIWVVFKNSTVAGYLATQAIAGTVTNFDLGGQFTKGGFLVAMATWTHDGGNGPDDYAVFISSEGQIAIYRGTDPSTADTWAKVGVFDLGPPIGRRCFVKVAGDVALVNVDGVLPLSQAIGGDRGASAAVAITKNINNAMNSYASLYRQNFGWQLVPYPKGSYVLLNIPIAEGNLQYQAVMNTITGAWCQFKGQNANCWVVWRDNLYFGGNDGKIYLADIGGKDGNAAIDAIGQCAHQYYGAAGNLKQWKMIRPIITTSAGNFCSIGISTDFKDNASLGTPVASTQSTAIYDAAVYDVNVYPIESSTVAEWSSVSGEGYCASIHFRSQKQSNSEMLMAVNGFNVIYETGLVL